MEITLPSMNNAIPFLSLSTAPISLDIVKQLVHLPANSTSKYTPPSCSNFNLIDGDSLLSRAWIVTGSSKIQPQFNFLYSHLNYSTCQWQFSAWYPVQNLIQSCAVTNSSESASRRVISITAISAYLEFRAEGVVIIASNQTSGRISALRTSYTYLPPPLHILPPASGGSLPQPYLFPISISQGAGGGTLQVFFYLVTASNHLLSPSNDSEHVLQLLYADKTGTSQVWLLEMDQSVQPVLLSFTHHTTEPCTQCQHKYLFHLPLKTSRADPRLTTLFLNSSTHLQENTLTIGMIINFTAEL